MIETAAEGRAQRGCPSRSRLRGVALCALTFSILGSIAGCHSRFVEATIENQSSHALQLVEVDYPSASFGTGAIPAHGLYHYRFKILGSGSVKLSFNDQQGKPHASTGPELDEGQEGSLRITIDDQARVQWTPDLRIPR